MAGQTATTKFAAVTILVNALLAGLGSDHELAAAPNVIIVMAGTGHTYQPFDWRLVRDPSGLVEAVPIERQRRLVRSARSQGKEKWPAPYAVV